MGLLGIFSKYKRNIADSEITAQSIVGKKCVVQERIDTFAGCGQVKIGGQSWAARGTGENDCFEIGEVLDIVAIEGVKVICVKHQ